MRYVSCPVFPFICDIPYSRSYTCPGKIFNSSKAMSSGLTGELILPALCSEGKNVFKTALNFVGIHSQKIFIVKNRIEDSTLL